MGEFLRVGSAYCRSAGRASIDVPSDESSVNLPDWCLGCNDRPAPDGVLTGSGKFPKESPGSPALTHIDPQSQPPVFSPPTSGNSS